MACSCLGGIILSSMPFIICARTAVCHFASAGCIFSMVSGRSPCRVSGTLSSFCAGRSGEGVLLETGTNWELDTLVVVTAVVLVSSVSPFR